LNWTLENRQERRRTLTPEDQRLSFERDRDRILYSSAFHRLSGVTQIVRSGEADLFHTRQQHSYKVAQVGRRLAQKCIADSTEENLNKWIHPEVVEAACLAHDLGHPPFGHMGEELLDELVIKHNVPEGFEGNAQSFRIVTKLSARFIDGVGLDLTRAILAACLKYPWFRDTENVKKSKKWASYKSEKEDFYFARKFCDNEDQTVEAQIMDWADDIAYSVHDLEDFHRFNVIPWDRILMNDGERSRIVGRAQAAWFKAPDDSKELLENAFEDLKGSALVPYLELLTKPYTGEWKQRQQLRELTSVLVGRFVKATSFNFETKTIDVNSDASNQVRILKQITRDYVLSSPSLAAQQYGQRKILETLFNVIMGEVDKKNPKPPKFLPIRLQQLWSLADESVPRFAADCISSLTEKEAVELHSRLTGLGAGSVIDPIVR